MKLIVYQDLNWAIPPKNQNSAQKKRRSFNFSYQKTIEHIEIISMSSSLVCINVRHQERRTDDWLPKTKEVFLNTIPPTKWNETTTDSYRGTNSSMAKQTGLQTGNSQRKKYQGQ